jgi:hypothetical protein
VCATAVDGPDQFRESVGWIVVASEREERSDVCATTASIAWPASERSMGVSTFAERGIDGTWPDPRCSPMISDPIIETPGRSGDALSLGHTASSLSVDSKAHEAAVLRSEILDVAAASRAPLRSTRMVLSTRIPSEKALRLLAP